MVKEKKPFKDVDPKFFFVEIAPQIYFEDKYIRVSNSVLYFNILVYPEMISYNDPNH